MRVFLKSEGSAFGTCQTRQHVIVAATAQELLEHAPKPDTLFIDDKHRVRALHTRTGPHVHTTDGHTLEITNYDPLQLQLLPLSESELLNEASSLWVAEHLDDVRPIVAVVGTVIGKTRAPHGYPSPQHEWTECTPLRATLDELVGNFVILLTQDGKQTYPISNGNHVYYTSDRQFVRMIRVKTTCLYCERLTPEIDDTAATHFFNGTSPEEEKPKAKRARTNGNGNGKANGNLTPANTA